MFSFCGDEGLESLHSILKPNEYRKPKISAEKVQEVIVQFPKSVSHQDNNGNLPLHYAVIHRLGIDVLKTLVDAYPEGSKVKNLKALLPMNLLFYNQLSIDMKSRNLLDDEFWDILLYLSEKYPEGLLNTMPLSLNHIKTNYHLPIHFIIDAKFKVKQEDKNIFESHILSLVNICPESLRVQDYLGNLPIHKGCFSDLSLNVIEHMADLYPESLLIKNTLGKLPIHLSSASNTYEVSSYLANRCPESLRVQDNDGQLPIFSICSKTNEADSKVLNIFNLVDIYPECLTIKDYDDMLLFHVMDPNNEAFLSLVKRYPECLRAKDKRGFLPIHSACAQNGNADTVEALALMYVESLLIQDNLMRLPIHYACKHSSSETILRLANLCPESVSMRDKAEGLPLHYACNSIAVQKDERVNLDVLKKLASIYPPALLDDFGYLGMLPIHLICDKFGVNETVVFFIETCPESVYQKCLSLGQLPLHYACRRLDLGAQFIDTLINAYPQSLMVANIANQLPLHIALLSYKNTQVECEVILRLISLCPESARIKTESCFPIHFASILCKGCVSALADVYPESLIEPSMYGLPIFCASYCTSKNEEWVETVLDLGVRCPDSISKIDIDGWEKMLVLMNLQSSNVVKIARLFVKLCNEWGYLKREGKCAIDICLENKNSVAARILMNGVPGVARVLYPDVVRSLNWTERKAVIAIVLKLSTDQQKCF